MKRTVLTMFANAVARYGNHPYVCNKSDDGWEKIGFKDAYGISKAFAAALIKKGFQKDEKIAVLSEGRSEWVMGELGLVMAGCVSVPLSIKLLPEEIPFRLIHSESKAILVSKITFPKVASILDKVKDIKLIMLDNDEKFITNICQEYQIDREKQVWLWDNLIFEGKEQLAEDSTKTESRISEAEENDVVTVCYTSGTTGNPKGIMLTHLNYFANCRDAADAFKIKEGLKTLVILPVDHSFAHTVALYTALIRKMSLYFVDAREGSRAILRNIPKNLLEVQPHFLLTVPALTSNFMKKIISGIDEKGGALAKIFHRGLKAAIRMDGNGFESPGVYYKLIDSIPRLIAEVILFKTIRKKVFGKNIQYCVGGGALLDVKQQQFFNAIGVPVYQGYGLTEATPVICTNTPKKHKFGTSGMVLPNIECRICDSDGNEVPHGTKGEIVIRGDNVMKGYLKNPEATADTLKDGWLFTGDLGYYDKDDFLAVVGREKALLISADGEKYSPEEIEEAIANCSTLVNQVMVYNNQKSYTTSVITLDEGAVKALLSDNENLSADALLDHIYQSFNTYLSDPSFKGAFPKVWCPNTFQITAEPFTEANQMINSTMKMVRHKITDHYSSRIEYMYTRDGHPYKNDQNRKVLSDLFGVK